MTVQVVLDEMARFPIYELEDQGGNSLARRLVAMGGNLGGVRLVLDDFARRLEDSTAKDADWDELRQFLTERLKFAEDLVLGRELTRPEWPPQASVPLP